MNLMHSKQGMLMMQFAPAYEAFNQMSEAYAPEPGGSWIETKCSDDVATKKKT